MLSTPAALLERRRAAAVHFKPNITAIVCDDVWSCHERIRKEGKVIIGYVILCYIMSRFSKFFFCLVALLPLTHLQGSATTNELA
jgi:hypothetical protein